MNELSYEVTTIKDNIKVIEKELKKGRRIEKLERDLKFDKWLLKQRETYRKKHAERSQD